MSKHQALLQEFQALALSADHPEALMEQMAHRIHEEMTRYSWVGFFLLNPDNPRMLMLGPYAGIISPQFDISVDEGLCGAVISSGHTIVVDDVSTDPRYSAVMELTKSEIVVPIFAHEQVVGEIDVNSYFLKTFIEPERLFVEACATLVGSNMEANSRTKQGAAASHRGSGDRLIW